MQSHAYANLFPMMDDTDHSALVADITANGLLHPIITHNGEVLDGRNRLRACEAAGIEPRFVELDSNIDPLTFVVSTNYSRRHLSESQRALAAARIQEHGTTPDVAATLFKVTKSATKQAVDVLKHGTAELIYAVEHDRLPVRLAAKLTTMPHDAQQDAVRLAPKQLRAVVKHQARLKKANSLVRATERAVKKFGEARYPVVLADPPWRFETWSENGKDRSAENHYPTMTTDSIAAIPCPALDNAVLFLWVPPSMLEHGLKVLNAWGFAYRSQFVWVKDKAGTGYWNRAMHELLLIGARGSMPSPAENLRFESVIEEPVTEHSVKPSAVHDMIESMYPNLARVEMFGRRARYGWEVIGNEVEPAEPSESPQEAVDSVQELT